MEAAPDKNADPEGSPAPPDGPCNFVTLRRLEPAGAETRTVRMLFPRLGTPPCFADNEARCEGLNADGLREHSLFFPARPGPVSFDRISDDDRDALRLLARDARFAIDVGTFLGASAEAMLEVMPADGHLVTVDTFHGTSGNETATVPQTHMLRYALERLSPHEDRRTIMVAKSADAARLIPDGIADLVFLDAGHRYESALADIVAWLPKVRPGGVFAGHDFWKWIEDEPPEPLDDRLAREHDALTQIHWGVVQAVTNCFTRIELIGGLDGAVWAARREDARAPDDDSDMMISHRPVEGLDD